MRNIEFSAFKAALVTPLPDCILDAKLLARELLVSVKEARDLMRTELAQFVFPAKGKKGGRPRIWRSDVRAWSERVKGGHRSVGTRCGTKPNKTDDASDGDNPSYGLARRRSEDPS